MAPAIPTEYVRDEAFVIPTTDDREFVYFVDRAVHMAAVPILLVVDGSSCIGQLRAGSADLYRPDEASPRPFARVLVEKPGVDPTAAYPSACSDEFLKYYTIDQRITDNMRTLQHLKAPSECPLIQQSSNSCGIDTELSFSYQIYRRLFSLAYSDLVS